MKTDKHTAKYTQRLRNRQQVYTKTSRWTGERQADRLQTGRQASTHRRTCRQADKHIECRQETGKQTHRQTSSYADEPKAGQAGGQ